MLNEDYKEMLQILLNNEVRFLIVGAYAMGVYGYPRATGDFDIWVEASEENSQKIYRSLVEFGASLSNVNEKTFAEEGIVLQIGVAPRRIDIITHLDGVDFQQSYNTREVIEVEDLKIPFISKEDLIKNKESTGRERDGIDAGYLKGIRMP